MNYQSLQGGVYKAEHDWVAFQNLFQIKKRQAKGNDRYASIGFIYRAGVELYC